MSQPNPTGQHTPGAIAAANEITDYYGTKEIWDVREQMAEIIDRHTAAPDLLAVAISIAAHFQNTDAPLGEQARLALRKAGVE